MTALEKAGAVVYLQYAIAEPLIASANYNENADYDRIPAHN